MGLGGSLQGLLERTELEAALEEARLAHSNSVHPLQPDEPSLHPPLEASTEGQVSQERAPTTMIDDPKPELVWACCDECGKWRILPMGAPVPSRSKRWICSMNVLDPAHGACNASEELDTEDESVLECAISYRLLSTTFHPNWSCVILPLTALRLY